MGNIVKISDHALASSGQRSGRSSDRETPVSRSIDNTNSAGTPRLDFSSQYQTWDCVVPMRSAKGFCPPAKPQARLSASFDMGARYPFLGQLQPKSLCKTANLEFGRLEPMKQVDPIKFGIRVRECREALKWSQGRLGKESGQSQTNIGWIESGRVKSPRRAVVALSEAMKVPTEYLLWGVGPKQIGPPIMSVCDLGENYTVLSLEDQADVSAFVAERVEAAKEKQKIG
jgi:transcriptional regulator with XRE-family HTH domain